MASSLVSTSEESNELVILVMNTDFATYVHSRDEEIASFIKQLNPKPDFLLLQEVKVTTLTNTREPIDQRVAIKDALGKYEERDGTPKSYISFETLESNAYINNLQIERIVSYNMIRYKEEHKGTQIRSNAKRYCAGQFTFNGSQTRQILFVSFHGNSQLDKTDLKLREDLRFKDITKANQTKAIKQFRLGEYLKIFHKLKNDNNCHHLIVGGDFNLNVDELLDVITIRRTTPSQTLLTQRQEEFIRLFNSLGLQIVPYIHQREGKQKYDALICDKSLSNDIKVRVYSNKPDRTVGDTSIKKFPFSKNSLDHDPLLFTIKIKVPTTEVQVPTTKVKLPTKEVQLPTKEVQLPTTKAQLPKTEEDVIAEALRTQMNLESQETAETDLTNPNPEEDENPTNQNPEVNLEASGSSLEGTSSGTRPKSTQKK
jgi:hypothetical protein